MDWLLWLAGTAAIQLLLLATLYLGKSLASLVAR